MHVGHGRWAALGDSHLPRPGARRLRRRARVLHQRPRQPDGRRSATPSPSATCSSPTSWRSTAATLRPPARPSWRRTARPYVAGRGRRAPRDPPLHRCLHRRPGSGNAYGGDLHRRPGRSASARARRPQVAERRSAGRAHGSPSASAATRRCSRPSARTRATTCPLRLRRLDQRAQPSTSQGLRPAPAAVDRALARSSTSIGYLYRTDDGRRLWFQLHRLRRRQGPRPPARPTATTPTSASDVAYHWNKFQRVDHVHRHLGRRPPRLHRSASRPACHGPRVSHGQFEVPLGQLVNLLRTGQPVRMSKRKGTMVTFRRAPRRGRCRRHPLHAREHSSTNQTIDFDIDARQGAGQASPTPSTTCSTPTPAPAPSCARPPASPRPRQADLMGMDERRQPAPSMAPRTTSASSPIPTERSAVPASSPSSAGPHRRAAPATAPRSASPTTSRSSRPPSTAFYAACQVLPSEGRPVEHELVRARLAACDATRTVIALSLTMVGVAALQTM